jgi:hypothetical protein
MVVEVKRGCAIPARRRDAMPRHLAAARLARLAPK